jgi:hypothetical protein
MTLSAIAQLVACSPSAGSWFSNLSHAPLSFLNVNKGRKKINKCKDKKKNVILWPPKPL